VLGVRQRFWIYKGGAIAMGRREVLLAEGFAAGIKKSFTPFSWEWSSFSVSAAFRFR
jgi:hypothetical protein